MANILGFLAGLSQYARGVENLENRKLESQKANLMLQAERERLVRDDLQTGIGLMTSALEMLRQTSVENPGDFAMRDLAVKLYQKGSEIAKIPSPDLDTLQKTERTTDFLDTLQKAVDFLQSGVPPSIVKRLFSVEKKTTPQVPQEQAPAPGDVPPYRTTAEKPLLPINTPLFQKSETQAKAEQAVKSVAGPVAASIFGAKPFSFRDLLTQQAMIPNPQYQPPQPPTTPATASAAASTTAVGGQTPPIPIEELEKAYRFSTLSKFFPYIAQMASSGSLGAGGWEALRETLSGAGVELPPSVSEIGEPQVAYKRARTTQALSESKLLDARAKAIPEEMRLRFREIENEANKIRNDYVIGMMRARNEAERNRIYEQYVNGRLAISSKALELQSEIAKTNLGLREKGLFWNAIGKVIEFLGNPLVPVSDEDASKLGDFLVKSAGTIPEQFPSIAEPFYEGEGAETGGDVGAPPPPTKGIGARRVRIEHSLSEEQAKQEVDKIDHSFTPDGKRILPPGWVAAMRGKGYSNREIYQIIVAANRRARARRGIK